MLRCNKKGNSWIGCSNLREICGHSNITIIYAAGNKSYFDHGVPYPLYPTSNARQHRPDTLQSPKCPHVLSHSLPLTWNHWKGDSDFERLSSTFAIQTDSTQATTLDRPHSCAGLGRGWCLALPTARQAPAVPQCSQRGKHVTAVTWLRMNRGH